jgi:hypothetical protein
MGQAERVTEHPQTRIRIGGEYTDVDEDIAALIVVINEAGIWTFLSCQDNNAGRGSVRRVWIHIAIHHLEGLINLLTRPGELDDYYSLSSRIAPEHEPEDDETYGDDKAWHYDLDVSRVDGEAYADVGVRFPFTDVPEVIARLTGDPRVSESEQS